ncbi:MAG: acyl-CoA reductase [Bacteroidetes bacterium]|nr:acyl-CoA reductase [Bacteroidota bacterium]
MVRDKIISSLNVLGNKFESIKPEDSVINQTHLENQWFVPQNTLLALKYWAQKLNYNELSNFSKNYSFNSSPKTIGLVAAGNIPLVGFHDLLCILLSGNICNIKLSASDTVLMKFAIDFLCNSNHDLIERINVVDKLNECNAYIATGSNNTARYFEYYFKSKPNIIRKNRNSVAVLTGNETDEDLKNLGFDIFSFFGLGCRNISKIFVPENYDFNKLFKNFENYRFVENHNKYFNNYVYHKAIFLMNGSKHFDNGFLLLKEDEGFYSPLSCLFYSFYKSIGEVEFKIKNNKDKIQIIVGENKLGNINFGKSQEPELNDFADGIDTMQFLSKI